MGNFHFNRKFRTFLSRPPCSGGSIPHGAMAPSRWSCNRRGIKRPLPKCNTKCALTRSMPRQPSPRKQFNWNSRGTARKAPKKLLWSLLRPMRYFFHFYCKFRENYLSTYEFFKSVVNRTEFYDEESKFCRAPSFSPSPRSFSGKSKAES